MMNSDPKPVPKKKLMGHGLNLKSKLA